MRYLKTFEEVYFNSRKEVEGYIDANDLVGQRLWFHTNRTHRNNGWNGMIGIYDTTTSGRKSGYAGRYTNEVRLSEPVFFQTSESGADSIKSTDRRILIAGVSGVVIPTNNDTTGMVKITYNPFDVAYFHEIGDNDKKEIISAEEVYFNATEEGNWDIWAKNPKYRNTLLKESIEEQIYKQVLDTIKDCFLEFEDNGWYWMTDITQPGISVWHMPNINCRMLKREDEYVPSELRDYIDVTGEIDSDGEIKYDTNEVNSDKSEVHQEVEDFISSVKRIHSENGLGFNFSYNNKGGEFRIIIQGSI